MGKLIYFYRMVFDRLLRDIDGGKVLDVGCGTGQFIEILDDSLKSIDSVTGVDVAEEFLSEARETGKPWLLYVAHNAPHSPLQCLEEDYRKYEV